MLNFDEPLDRALVERVVRVVDPGDRNVKGRVQITDGETVWRFEPAEPWAPGQYFVMVAPSLTDRAGNSMSRLFDTSPGNTKSDSTPIRLPFDVAGTP